MIGHRTQRRDARPVTVDLTDTFIRDVYHRLALQPPERGGAIIGFGGTASALIEDDFGAYSTTSYDISAELTRAIAAVERAGRGRLLGTVHTHPDFPKDPSGRDEVTMRHALEMNPHLDRLLVCIVTRDPARATDLPIGPGFSMSIHVMMRRGGQIDMVPAVGRIVPVGDDLDRAGLPVPGSVTVSQALTGDLGALPPVLRVNGVDKLIARHRGSIDGFLVDAAHPGVPPILASDPGDGLCAVDVSWTQDQPLGAQMGQILAERAHPPAEPTAVVDPITDPTPGTPAGQDDDPLARVRDLVGTMTDRTVLVAGAGSVGSRITEDLARSGVGAFILIDPDTVSAANLARSVYTSGDIGDDKVTALAQRVRAINPAAQVRTVAASLSEVDVMAELTGCDLVVLATDDMRQQAVLAAQAYEVGIAQVGCALYRKAAAGEVIVIIPHARTACWSCCVGTNVISTSQRPDANYGVTTRLVAESGLGASINLVASVASLAAVGVLAGPASYAGSHWAPLVAGGRTMGLISTAPKWDFFADLMGDAHQSHPQSAWPRLERNPECPVCGSGPTDVLTSDIEQDFMALVAATRSDHPEPSLQLEASPTAGREHPAP